MSWRQASAAGAIVWLLGATGAQARVVITHDGRQAWPAGPVPAPFADTTPPGYEAGYSCETVGLLWADLVRYDCRPCLVNPQTQSYMSLDGASHELVAAIERRFGPEHVRSGRWERHGRWVLLVGLLAAGAALIALVRRRPPVTDEQETDAPPSS